MNKVIVYILFGIFALSLSSNVAVSTSWTKEAGELPFQVNQSDRIVIGTVKSINPGFEFTDVTISVDEWLKNPLSRDEITVRTEQGTNAFTAGAANFSLGKKALLMLKDEDAEKGRFRMLNMELGKHNISDRDAVIKEIANLSGSTKSVIRPPGGIQPLDPEVAKPAITKENASSIAARMIPMPVEKARIALVKDTHRYKTYWEFAYVENAENQAMLEIDATTGEVLAYFGPFKIGNKVSITEKQALEKAKESLFGFGINIDALELSQPDIKLNEQPKEKFYNIRWIQQKNGIPVYYGWITAGIDADTGGFISFVKQLNDVSGVDITPRITKNDVIATAKDFVAKNYDFTSSEVVNAGLEIRPLFHDEGAKGILTWKVTLGEQRLEYSLAEVWVDANNGNVVASDRTKGAGSSREVKILPIIIIVALIAVVLLVLYKKYWAHR